MIIPNYIIAVLKPSKILFTVERNITFSFQFLQNVIAFGDFVTKFKNLVLTAIRSS